MEPKELAVYRTNIDGALHDIVKYTDSLWFSLELHNSGFDEITDPDFLAGKKAFFSVSKRANDLMRKILTENPDKKIKLAEIRKIKADTRTFESRFGRFIASANCPKKLSEIIGGLLVSAKMTAPLFDVISEGKYELKIEPIKVRELVSELQRYLKKANSKNISVSFNLKGNPIVFADPLHLRRAIFNLFHDAVTHSNGEPVVVNVEVAKGNFVFSTLNKGRVIDRKVVSAIGKRPYSTNAMREAPHGYGKIAAFGIARAHGGKAKAENTRTGFKISLAIPQRKGLRAA